MWEKNKETIKCDKSTVKCNNGTIKCEKKKEELLNLTKE